MKQQFHPNKHSFHKQFLTPNGEFNPVLFFPHLVVKFTICPEFEIATICKELYIFLPIIICFWFN
jgi:hypothetical protein